MGLPAWVPGTTCHLMRRAVVLTAQCCPASSSNITSELQSSRGWLQCRAKPRLSWTLLGPQAPLASLRQVSMICITGTHALERSVHRATCCMTFSYEMLAMCSHSMQLLLVLPLTRPVQCMPVFPVGHITPLGSTKQAICSLPRCGRLVPCKVGPWPSVRRGAARHLPLPAGGLGPQ